MKIIITFMHWLMLSCKRATQLMEKSMHFGLNPIEKVQLSMHKKACKYCKAYEKQNKIIESILQEGLENHVHAPSLSEDNKKNMLEEIESHTK